ncbi:alanine racemase [bacterium]|nr:alanine racemase [bacterium]
MICTSYIELDSLHYAQNIKFIKKLAGMKTNVCAVIKGNAYGHGASEIAIMAQKNHINTLAVFSAQEAFQVLRAIDRHKTRLIIMGNLDASEIDWALENNIELFVHDLHSFNLIQVAARKLNKKALIHLEIETGMNRFGLESSDLEIIAKLYKNQQNSVRIEGLCTHYSGAESISNFERVKSQIKQYDKLSKIFLPQLGSSITKHTACSAAMIRFPKTRYDMVRIGILQYGLWPSQETRIDYSVKKNKDINPLSPVLSWKTKVLSLKKVSKGQFIGYGTSYQASEDKHLAIIPVGYANGFSRSLSNQGIVLIRGKRAPVTGIVNMNVVSVDVTKIPEVCIGDDVTLIGKDGEEEISIASFADYSSQLNYELLTRLPSDIPRIIK